MPPLDGSGKPRHPGRGASPGGSEIPLSEPKTSIEVDATGSEQGIQQNLRSDPRTAEDIMVGTTRCVGIGYSAVHHRRPSGLKLFGQAAGWMVGRDFEIPVLIPRKLSATEHSARK